MEQKPLKRSKHILQLSKDHHFTLLFSWKIRQGLKQGVEGERIRKYVKHFWDHDMQPHFREEEEILFAPVKDDKVRKAIEDHEQIKMQVDKILESPGEATSELLGLLADTVDAHVRYEERELFPYLENKLSEKELERIGVELSNKPVLQDEYADEFWQKK
jgi:hemerythrin superfamily protein